jgi:hypothetical protein
MLRAGIAAVLFAFSVAALAQTQSWTYGYADLQYGRHKFTFTVRADPAAEAATRSGAYLARELGGVKMALEYMPYALAGGEPPASWPVPYGYPVYSTPYLEWKYAVRAGGWESVTVPAGTFRALRVEVEGNRGKDPDPFWWPKQAARFQHTIWYAPEAKRYVKARHQAWSMTGAPFADDAIELLEIRND